MHTRNLRILVTNDDGYNSKGIKTLAELLSEYGDVTVLAPAEPHSGMSTALSLENILRLKKIDEYRHNGHTIEIHALTGTPTDCVKLAMNRFFSIDNKPDLLVAGINHGSNASIASIYSGTLGATIEGTIYGVPSLGVSLDTHSSNPDFSGVTKFLPGILRNFMKHPPAKNVYLNVNFPDIAVEQIKGIRFAKQGYGMWIKEFENRFDPHGREYFWMTGEFIDTEPAENGDHKLVGQGYISIVPHTIDTTDYKELERLEKCWDL